MAAANASQTELRAIEQELSRAEEACELLRTEKAAARGVVSSKEKMLKAPDLDGFPPHSPGIPRVTHSSLACQDTLAMSQEALGAMKALLCNYYVNHGKGLVRLDVTMQLLNSAIM